MLWSQKSGNCSGGCLSETARLTVWTMWRSCRLKPHQTVCRARGCVWCKLRCWQAELYSASSFGANVQLLQPLGARTAFTAPAASSVPQSTHAWRRCSRCVCGLPQRGKTAVKKKGKAQKYWWYEVQSRREEGCSSEMPIIVMVHFIHKRLKTEKRTV